MADFDELKVFANDQQSSRCLIAISTTQNHTSTHLIQNLNVSLKNQPNLDKHLKHPFLLVNGMF
ncbi:MAG: hypothetical protein IPN86_14455 [Saprospiraceae bacterium]|nr:hypothetical protein [Saprospiraceae bacterium]